MPEDKWSNSARHFYDKEAVKKSNSHTYNEFVSAYKKLLGRFLDINGNVLDIGCGTGFLTKALTNTPCRVVGIDASEESLKVARNNNSQGEFVNADMTHIPFPANSFQFAFAITSIEFCKDKQKALHEIANQLSNDGKLYMEVRNASFGLFKLPKGLLTLLTKLGLIHPYEAETFRDLSIDEWRKLIKDSPFEIIEEFPSVRPWNYGSLLTRLKNALIRVYAVLFPLSSQYMVGFYCKKKI